jgi:hypothetical protein
MPFYADIKEIQSDPASIRPGAVLMTQNQLSTLIASAGYEYSADKRNMFHSRITWKGWYPVFESRFDYGSEAAIYNVKSDGNRAPDPKQIFQGYQFINTVSLPLTISSGRFSQFFYLAGSSNFQNDYLYLNETSKYSLGMTQLSGRFYFTNYYRTALRDLYPKWAQAIDLIYSWYPFEKDYFGSSLTLKSVFYFPGILYDNSIRVRLEAEKQTSPYKFYSLGNRISFSRSYNNISSLKAEFISVDYFVPLVYPDFNIASLLYLKRIRAGLFYDYTRGNGNTIKTFTDGNYTVEFHDYAENFESYGLTLMSDFYILRIPYMISAGVQTAFRSFKEKPYFGFLFNINIYGMSIGKKPGP